MTDHTLAAMDLAASFIKEQQQRIAELESALFQMVSLFRGTCSLMGRTPDDYIEFTNACDILDKEKRS